MPAVTLAGETLRGSMVEGGRAVKGLLAPRREVRELAGRLDELEALLVVARERIAGERARAGGGDVRGRGPGRAHPRRGEGARRGRPRPAPSRPRSSCAPDRKAGVLETERAQAEEESGAARRCGWPRSSRRSLGAEDERDARQRAPGRGWASRWCRRGPSPSGGAAGVRRRRAATSRRCASAWPRRRRTARGSWRDHEDLLERIDAAQARANEMDQRHRELATERAEAERLLAEALTGRDQVGGRGSRWPTTRVTDLRNELDEPRAGAEGAPPRARDAA